MKRFTSMLALCAITIALFAPFGRHALAQTPKTRVVDRVVDVSGNPRRGFVTFILTQKTASGPAGIVSTGSSVSASLDSAGRFDVSIYSGTALNPKGYFQVWFSDSSTGTKELLGIYDIPATSSIVTLAPYKVTDTNLAVQYTFASQADVTALIAAVSTYTLNQLNAVSRTNNVVQKYQTSSGNFIDSSVTDGASAVAVSKNLAVTGNQTVSGNSTISGSEAVNGNLAVGGNVNAATFTGNGAGLTGITGATGGISNTGSTTVIGDSDANGVGKISLQTGASERIGIEANGTVEIPGSVIVGGCAGTDDSTLLSGAVSTASGGWVVIPNGQTCAGSDISIPNLRIEKGGLLKPVTSHTVTLTNFQAGNYQVFTNALATQGTIAISNTIINPLWWKTNTTPGTTDMTTGFQAALTASGGVGHVHFPLTTGIVTETLTIPQFASSGSQSFATLTISGEGGFQSNLVNHASSGKPTLLINRDGVTVRGLGFWGDAAYPNDGIKVSLAGRIHIENNTILVNGNGIYLKKAQSIWVKNNYGLVSAGSSLFPPGMTGGWTSGATDSFIYCDLDGNGEYVTHLIIADNMNEGACRYQVYTKKSGTGFALAWSITGNQFESSADGGLKLINVDTFTISDNYLVEGQTNPNADYAIDIQSCRNGRVGPDYIHVNNGEIDQKMSAVRLYDSPNVQLLGAMSRLYISGGSSLGVVATAAFIDRVQDESTDHRISFDNVTVTNFTPPLNTLNAQSGRAVLYSDTTSNASYPTARLGDRIWKVTPAPADSPGWICTTASSAGALVQVTGTGPDPVVLSDYAHPTAYDFRITMLSSGATGTATYKVEWKTAGGGSYANLTNTTTTTELAHLIKNETGGGGPSVSFAVRWPTGVSYVSGDQWTLTAVIAPVWTPMADLQ